jgi:hypothetical protein
MSKHQYRLDLRTLQLRDFRRELIATVLPDPEGGAIVQTSSGRFAMARSLVMSHIKFSGIYETENQKLQWRPLSLWHGVYGWTLSEGPVAIRFVPSARESGQYLVTVERPIANEIRLIGLGAYLLKLTGTDFVAWTAIASGVNAI